MNGVSKQKMIELDEKMIHEYGISLESMMEQAGKAFAFLAMELYPNAKRFCIFAGSGNNGGGGLVAARYLSENGMYVRVVLTSVKIKKVPQTQLEKIKKTNIDILDDNEDLVLEDIDVVLDALLGYNIKGEPKGVVAQLVTRLRNFTTPVVSLDVPSGLDPDMGVLYKQKTIKAEATLAIAYPKAGLLKNKSEEYTGEIYVADIGVPHEWYKENEIDLTFNGEIFKKY
jgi:NAD(P)H-hydrate epimerase